VGNVFRLSINEVMGWTSAHIFQCFHQKETNPQLQRWNVFFIKQLSWKQKKIKPDWC